MPLEGRARLVAPAGRERDAAERHQHARASTGRARARARVPRVPRRPRPSRASGERRARRSTSRSGSGRARVGLEERQRLLGAARLVQVAPRAGATTVSCGFAAPTRRFSAAHRRLEVAGLALELGQVDAGQATCRARRATSSLGSARAPSHVARPIERPTTSWSSGVERDEALGVVGVRVARLRTAVAPAR